MESASGMFPTDQTPTPTRFIRNCEEVGLFQDLQNNPFDETFRIAVESSVNDLPLLLQEPLLQNVSEETLNTPHVMPSKYTSQVCDTSYISKEMEISSFDTGESMAYEEEDISPEEYISSIISQDEVQMNVEPSTSSYLDRNNSFITASSRNSVLDMCIGANVQKQLKTNSQQILYVSPASSTSVSPNMTSTTQMISSADSTTITKNRTIFVPNGEMKSMSNVAILPQPTPVTDQCNPLSVKEKLRDKIRNSPSFVEEIDVEPTETEITYEDMNEESVVDIRKELYRERNRAAQMRCRMKKKVLMNKLKKHTDDMSSQIVDLQAEVAHLKYLLQAHKQCSVTKAMYKVDVPAATVNNRLPTRTAVTYAPVNKNTTITSVNSTSKCISNSTATTTNSNSKTSSVANNTGIVKNTVNQQINNHVNHVNQQINNHVNHVNQINNRMIINIPNVKVCSSKSCDQQLPRAQITKIINIPNVKVCSSNSCDQQPPRTPSTPPLLSNGINNMTISKSPIMTFISNSINTKPNDKVKMISVIQKPIVSPIGSVANVKPVPVQKRLEIISIQKPLIKTTPASITPARWVMKPAESTTSSSNICNSVNICTNASSSQIRIPNTKCSPIATRVIRLNPNAMHKSTRPENKSN